LANVRIDGTYDYPGCRPLRWPKVQCQQARRARHCSVFWQSFQLDVASLERVVAKE